MNAHDNNAMIDDATRACFRSDVSFSLDEGQRPDAATTVYVAQLPAGSADPERLDTHHLPYLTIPEDRPPAVGGESRLALVAVEGRDRKMAEALSELLDPSIVSIGLMHVTWMPKTIVSPLEEGGMDNPEVGDLLVYQGAREALIDTASALRQAGFYVSTHLREDRDPARPLAATIRDQNPDLFILGLGRHGAGIGRRVLEEVRIPVLFVRAR